MVLALALRSLTTLSMAASCLRKNGRMTRLYKISEPFHVTGAMHHTRNTHWEEEGEQRQDGMLGNQKRKMSEKASTRLKKPYTTHFANWSVTKFFSWSKVTKRSLK
ncbi:hypothetical protein EYF80_036467 [Liparis tanakae]|uniref:Secreted protein n=1 Tax=Liparis tanakae TaxID=230148 RepID=A0A4Z2GKU5_9TELE|nr:hypothetical protein EYF80_036467 [Liparis tanakae]